MPTPRELREERGKLHAQAFELANTPKNSKEDRANVDKMLADADDLKERIDQLERIDALGNEFRDQRTAPPAVDPAKEPLTPEDEEANAKRFQARQHKAWVQYMKNGWASRPTASGHTLLGISNEERSLLTRGGKPDLNAADIKEIHAELRRLGMSDKELRDMGTGGQGAYPGATTGFFVPVGFVNRVEEALKFFGPMLNGGPGMPEIFDTATGQVLPFPTDNDTTVVGELIGENQQVTTGDVALGQILLGAYKFSTKLIKISIELLQDSAFDMESFLVKKFGNRLGRILNTYFTTGTGTNQPKGIVPASTLGVAGVGSASNDGTAAGANTVGSDDLINLEHSVDPLYRPGSLYMFHDSTLRSLKTLKDKFGRPLWLPGLATGTPDTINSYGYRINNDMDQLQTVATSPVVVNKTILFGQLSKYLIRRVKDMSVIRLDERFADYGQVAFLAFARYDGQMLDAGTHPVRYLSSSY